MMADRLDSGMGLAQRMDLFCHGVLMSRITDKQLVELITRRNLPPSDPRFISREAVGRLLDGTLGKSVLVTAVEPDDAPVLMWRKVNTTTIEVNLDAPPNLPFTGAEVEWTTPGQTGWVKVEKKDGNLYVADCEVNLFLTDSQKSGSTKGHNVRESLQDKAVLHPNILDAIFENQHLIPESWKQNEYGETLFIYFWAVGFRGSVRNLCVRFLRWSGSRWYWLYDYLEIDWRAYGPAAVAN